MFTILIFISIPCTISCSSNVVFSGFCFSKIENLFYSSIMRSIISAEKYLAKYSTGSSRFSSNVCSSSKNSIGFVFGVFFSNGIFWLISSLILTFCLPLFRLLFSLIPPVCFCLFRLYFAHLAPHQSLPLQNRTHLSLLLAHWQVKIFEYLNLVMIN